MFAGCHFFCGWFHVVLIVEAGGNFHSHYLSFCTFSTTSFNGLHPQKQIPSIHLRHFGVAVPWRRDTASLMNHRDCTAFALSLVLAACVREAPPDRNGPPAPAADYGNPAKTYRTYLEAMNARKKRRFFIVPFHAQACQCPGHRHVKKRLSFRRLTHACPLHRSCR